MRLLLSLVLLSSHAIADNGPALTPDQYRGVAQQQEGSLQPNLPGGFVQTPEVQGDPNAGAYIEASQPEERGSQDSDYSGGED